MGEIESAFRESCTMEVLNFSSFRKLYLSFQKPVSYLRAFAVYDLLSSCTLETKFPLSLYAYRTNRMVYQVFHEEVARLILTCTEHVVKVFHPIKMRCQGISLNQNTLSRDFTQSECVVEGFFRIKISCQRISLNQNAL